MKWAIVCIPIIIYFIFVALSAAYVTDRYLFPIYAVTFGLFICVMTVFWNKLIGIKYVYIVVCLIGVIFVINGFENAQWDYLYKTSEELLTKNQEYSELNCLSVFDISWKEQEAFCVLKNYKSVTFISQEHIDNISQYSALFGNELILTVIGGNDDEIISIVQQNYPHLEEYEKIGEYGYSSVYHIYSLGVTP